MDRERAAGLAAEMRAQFRLVERVSAKLRSRVEDGLNALVSVSVTRTKAKRVS